MVAPARKQVNVKMPESLIEALKVKAQADKTTFTDLVIQACEQLLGIEDNGFSATGISAVRLDECIFEQIAPLEERISALERKVARSLLSMGR